MQDTLYTLTVKPNLKKCFYERYNFEEHRVIKLFLVVFVDEIRTFLCQRLKYIHARLIVPYFNYIFENRHSLASFHEFA